MFADLQHQISPAQPTPSQTWICGQAVSPPVVLRSGSEVVFKVPSQTELFLSLGEGLSQSSDQLASADRQWKEQRRAGPQQCFLIQPLIN